MKRGRLYDRTAVVTGAGRGLGRAVAAGLAHEGARLWVCARTKAELDHTVRLIRGAGGRVEARMVDLAEAGACASFVEEVLSGAGSVDVLVNNAGILRVAPVEEVSPGDWSRTLAVNLTAPFLLTRDFLPAMRGRGGSVINVSSRAGVMGFVNECAYCASKFGLEGLTRALALELAETGISVNTVTPGLRIKPTSLTEEAFETAAEDQKDLWQDPARLVPAFLCLAGLRGGVTGLRFDALKLSLALERNGFDMAPERVRELAE